MNKDFDDDFALFREQVKVDRRIRSETHQPERRRSNTFMREPQQLDKRQRAAAKQQHAEFFFSDTFRAHLPEGAVRYCVEGESTHVLKQLRRGDYPPEIMLDLHGMTQAMAKREIAALLHTCQREQLACCSIMSGHGKGILKENLPHWLIQHPAVRAFHQAPKEYGGAAALLVLIQLRDL